MTSTVPPGRDLSASLPRHFVPGYDQPVPSGTKAIRPSKRHTIILALMGLTEVGVTILKNRSFRVPKF